MKKYLGIGVGILLALFLVAPNVVGVASRFTQQILPTDCILTVVATGDGPQVVGECPNEQPQVTGVENTASGDRVIRGVYDADRTNILRLIFRGVTYTANTPGSPLTVSGDTWVFAIEQIVPLVEAGNYTLILEADLVDGRTLTTIAAVTLDAAGESEPDPGFDPILPIAPSTGNTGFLNGIIGPFVITEIQAPSTANLPGFGNMLLILDDGTGLMVSMPSPFNDMLRALVAAGIIGLVWVAQAVLHRRRLS